MKTGIAYFHTRDPRHFERDLDDMVEHGCNFVVHTFSELDMAYYNQAMAKIIAMTKQRGLEVYLDPWGFGGVYGGETFSRFVAENLNARQVKRDGRSVPAACPNQPAFREFQKRWIQRAADLGADVCFWDEPHFHFDQADPASLQNWSCRCEECRRIFKEVSGGDLPEELTQEVELFRQQSLLDFLSENCREAKKLGMRNCVCVLPDEGEGTMGRAAGTSSWDKIARIPEVDVFGTDPYWVVFAGEVDEYVRRHCLRVKEICVRYGKESQVWVQAFLIPEGREEEVRQAVKIIWNAGIQNIAAWAYRGAHLIDIRCSQPEKVWDILGKSYRKVKGF
jgi:hypothetical protein